MYAIRSYYETVAGHFVAVLSHSYWANRLGADPGVLNKTIVINGQAMTIVGVTARGFDGTTLGARPDVFVPMTMRGVMVRGFDGFENRRSYWAYLFGRLKPGVSIRITSYNVCYTKLLRLPLLLGPTDHSASGCLGV